MISFPSSIYVLIVIDFITFGPGFCSTFKALTFFRKSTTFIGGLFADDMRLLNHFVRIMLAV
jgi:hypothetical protein